MQLIDPFSKQIYLHVFIAMSFWSISRLWLLVNHQYWILTKIPAYPDVATVIEIL